MRRSAVAVVLLLPGAAWPADPDRAPSADRIDRLVRQLGDPSFARREAASRELERAGAAAADALRRAAARDPDAEVRDRAGRLLRAVADREAGRFLASLAGSWKSPNGWMTVAGDRWAAAEGTYAAAGLMWVAGRDGPLVRVNFIADEGPFKGKVCKAIFRPDGDDLHYCGTYDDRYPTEFKTQGNDYACVYRRQK